ncbi:MAG: DMT family transporter [Nanoarchaeota archaeon]|nr:DMT family transporter [Nanoarchaeota archaeon]
MRNAKIIGSILIAVAAILWGLDGVVLTPRLFNLDVAFVVFMLHAVPFVLMNIFMFNQYKYLSKFSRQDFIILGLIALFGGAVGTLSIVKALFLVNFQHLSVIVLLQKLQPIFAIILAAILLREKIKGSFVVWAGLAIFASYFLTFGLGLPDFQTGSVGVAALYALLAAFSFGSATVFGKMFLKKYDYKTGTFYRFGITAAFMLVFVLLFGDWQLSSVTGVNWLIFLIIAVTTGSGAIFIYYYGLTRVKASVSTICELFFPVSAIVFDYLINGHVLSLVQWIATIVLVGVVVKISLDHARK